MRRLDARLRWHDEMSTDHDIAIAYMPGGVREAVRAVFALDEAMGDVVARSTQPALGAIKLAWWREALEALDSRPPPAEPRLQDAAAELLPRGISGTRLGELEAGWAALLQPDIDAEAVAGRGALLFGIAGELLGAGNERLADAGALYALAKHSDLAEAGRERLARLAGHRFERRLRPLTMLARAAARDLTRREPEGGRARVAAMLAHRWSGRVRG